MKRTTMKTLLCAGQLLLLGAIFGNPPLGAQDLAVSSCPAKCLPVKAAGKKSSKPLASAKLAPPLPAASTSAPRALSEHADKTPSEGNPPKPKDPDAVLINLLLAVATLYAITFTMLGVIVQVGAQNGIPNVFRLGRFDLCLGISLAGIFTQALTNLGSSAVLGYTVFGLNLLIIGLFSYGYLSLLDPYSASTLIVDAFFLD